MNRIVPAGLVLALAATALLMTVSSSDVVVLNDPPDSVHVVDGSIAFNVQSPEPRTEVVVYARLYNPAQADVDAATQMTVSEADGPGFEELSIPVVRVPAGEERVVSGVWAGGPTGTYDVKANAFPQDKEHDLAYRHIPVERKLGVGTTVGDGQLLLTAGLLNIGNLERGETRTVPVEVTAYNRTYPAVRLVVLENPGIDVAVLSPPVDVADGQTIQMFLRIDVPAQDNATPVESRRVLVQAVATDGHGSNVESLDVVLHEENFAGIPFLGAPGTVAAVAAAGGMAAFFRRLQRTVPVPDSP